MCIYSRCFAAFVPEGSVCSEGLRYALSRYNNCDIYSIKKEILFPFEDM